MSHGDKSAPSLVRTSSLRNSFARVETVSQRQESSLLNLPAEDARERRRQAAPASRWRCSERARNRDQRRWWRAGGRASERKSRLRLPVKRRLSAPAESRPDLSGGGRIVRIVLRCLAPGSAAPNLGQREKSCSPFSRPPPAGQFPSSASKRSWGKRIKLRHHASRERNGRAAENFASAGVLPAHCCWRNSDFERKRERRTFAVAALPRPASQPHARPQARIWDAPGRCATAQPNGQPTGCVALHCGAPRRLDCAGLMRPGNLNKPRKTGPARPEQLKRCLKPQAGCALAGA